MNNNFYLEGKFSIRIMLDRHAPVEGSSCRPEARQLPEAHQKQLKINPMLMVGFSFMGLFTYKRRIPRANVEDE